LAVFGAIAAVDWVAVARRSKPLEYVCKPGCMVALVAAALAMDPADGSARAWLVAALVLSTAGDVFLMLPSRPFVAGLAAFLLAHIAFIAGFIVDDVDTQPLALGIAAGLALYVGVGRSLVLAAHRSDEPAMAPPVAIYALVISIMLATAFGTGDWRAAVGAVVFASSDALIARERFVRETAAGPLAIIVTYHVAQALLLLSFS
jgi:uncharacterized membrane protein YhhN